MVNDILMQQKKIPRNIQRKQNESERIMKANLQRKGSTSRHVVLELVDVAGAAFVMMVLMVVLMVALIVVVIVRVKQVYNGR